MIEVASEDRRRNQEAHTLEVCQLQERQTREVRNIQVEHHNHMSQELVRHMEEVRRLQEEYHSQLKAFGADMRFTANGAAKQARTWGCMPADMHVVKEMMAKETERRKV